MEENELGFTAKIIDDDAVNDTTNEVVNDVVEETQEDIVESSSEAVETIETTSEEIVNEEDVEISDELLLSYLKERYNKEFSSIDDIIKDKEVKEIPEDIQKYLEFKEETGRSYNDYLEYTKDFSTLTEEQRISNYLKIKNPDFDEDDIRYELEQFQIDEEYDTEKEQRHKKVERKKILAEADKVLEEYRSKYGSKLESNNVEVPSDYEEIKSHLNEINKQNEEIEKSNLEARDYFMSETQKLFSNDFKGFEFDLGEKKQAYIPTDLKATVEVQSNIENFIKKHIGNDGKIINAQAYHKAIAMALNPDAMARFFYEQGKTDAVLDIKSNSKNIDMTPRQSANDVKSTSGFSFKISD